MAVKTALARSTAVPRRLTRTATRPLPLRLLPLAVGAVALLAARIWQRSPTEASAAARAWADVPSAPPWDVPSPPSGALPIKRYEHLRAAEIAKAVRRLAQPAQVQQVLDYEEAHDRRVTVFRAAKARLRALETAR